MSATDGSREPVDPPRTPLARVCAVGLWGGTAALLAGTLLAASARWFWLGEVATSFRWQLGLGAVAWGLIALLARAPRRALFALAVAAWGAGPELALALGTPPAREGREELVVMVANVLWNNDRHDGVLALVRAVDPDVLAVLEGSRASTPVYDRALADAYPHRHAALDTDQWDGTTWAVKLYSKQPLQEASLVPFDAGVRTRPGLEATLALDGTPLTLQVVHAPRAGKAWRNASRDHVLHALVARSVPGERVLLGDLNVTSTSPTFARLLREGELRDSRAGFGRQASFDVSGYSPLPALSPWLSRLDAAWIAIDHALVSDGLDVLDRRVEPIPGSDHRAVVVTLAARTD